MSPSKRDSRIRLSSKWIFHPTPLPTPKQARLEREAFEEMAAKHRKWLEDRAKAAKTEVVGNSKAP